MHRLKQEQNHSVRHAPSFTLVSVDIRGNPNAIIVIGLDIGQENAQQVREFRRQTVPTKLKCLEICFLQIVPFLIQK